MMARGGGKGVGWIAKERTQEHASDVTHAP
jgi:hypothetical protein